MPVIDATRPRGDERAVSTYLRCHAYAAAARADDLIAAGEHHEAAVPLLEASELYRLAAQELDHDISPTGR